MKTSAIPKPKNWRRPEILLLLMAGGVPLSFATWQELDRKTRTILEADRYGTVSAQALEWACRNTCERLADQVLRRSRQLRRTSALLPVRSEDPS